MVPNLLIGLREGLEATLVAVFPVRTGARHRPPAVAGVVVHAVRTLTRLAAGTAVVRWAQPGFGKTASTDASTDASTPRNLSGFKDGTANLSVSDVATLDEHVWVGADDDPAAAWLPATSHVRLAHPGRHGGARLLWRDPALVSVQSALARDDGLNGYLRHTGSGVWAVPPGAAEGGWLAQPLLDARAHGPHPVPVGSRRYARVSGV